MTSEYLKTVVNENRNGKEEESSEDSIELQDFSEQKQLLAESKEEMASKKEENDCEKLTELKESSYVDKSKEEQIIDITTDNFSEFKQNFDAPNPSYLKSESIHQHPHHNQHDVFKLFTQSMQMNFTRGYSFFCYVFNLLLFLRNNLELSADFNTIGLLANWVREISRYINNQAKEMKSRQAKEELRQLFVDAHATALIQALITCALAQGYVFSMPVLARDPRASHELRFVPLASSFNYGVLMVMTNQAYLGYALDQEGALLRIYIMGGTMMFTYVLARQYDASIYTFLGCNSIQMSTNVALYYLYLYKYHSDMHYLSALFSLNAWSKAGKRGLSLIYNSFQLGFVSFFNIFSNVGANLLIRDPNERAAYQGLMSVASIFYAMCAIQEMLITRHTIHAKNHLNKQPQALQRELNKIRYNFLWIGNLLPITAAIATAIWSEQITNYAVRPSPNLNAQAVATSFNHNLLWMFTSIGLSMFRSVGYGMVLGGKSSAEHNDVNLRATITSCSAYAAATLIGFGLDYGFDSGAWGYCLGTIITAALSGGAQWYLADKFSQREIANAEKVAREEISEDIEKVSSENISSTNVASGNISSKNTYVVSSVFSWCGFWKTDENNHSTSHENENTTEPLMSIETITEDMENGHIAIASVLPRQLQAPNFFQAIRTGIINLGGSLMPSFRWSW